MLMGVCGFQERAARGAIAGFGDAALTTPGTRAVFAPNQTEIAHELARGLKAYEIAQLGHDSHSVNRLDAAQRLQCSHHWLPTPVLALCGNGISKPIEPQARLMHRLHILFECDLLGRMRQLRNSAPCAYSGLSSSQPLTFASSRLLRKLWATAR